MTNLLLWFNQQLCPPVIRIASAIPDQKTFQGFFSGEFLYEKQSQINLPRVWNREAILKKMGLGTLGSPLGLIDGAIVQWHFKFIEELSPGHVLSEHGANHLSQPFGIAENVGQGICWNIQGR